MVFKESGIETEDREVARLCYNVFKLIHHPGMEGDRVQKTKETIKSF